MFGNHIFVGGAGGFLGCGREGCERFLKFYIKSLKNP